MKNRISRKLIERFSRQIILKKVGTNGQKKIINSKVLIVGVGGLGCPVAELLARAGVGYIGIIDNDNITLSNLHRQTLYDVSDIGKKKGPNCKKQIKTH